MPAREAYETNEGQASVGAGQLMAMIGQVTVAGGRPTAAARTTAAAACCAPYSQLTAAPPSRPPAQSKHLTAGWVGFAVKSLAVSSSAATVFGLARRGRGAAPLPTALERALCPQRSCCRLSLPVPLLTILLTQLDAVPRPARPCDELFGAMFFGGAAAAAARHALL